MVELPSSVLSRLDTSGRIGNLAERGLPTYQSHRGCQ